MVEARCALNKSVYFWWKDHCFLVCGRQHMFSKNTKKHSLTAEPAAAASEASL